MTTLIQKATARQNNAADVNHSVWLSASAGTGKTRVLTTRIVRLLLSDLTLNPSEILAVTFTRAAAREMENRIRSVLSSWVNMPEEKLIKELEETLARTPTAEEVVRARSLFSIVLNDAVHTNTIHGFCQHLLGRFPVEAGLSPGFRVLDETESGELLAQARTQTLVKAFSGEVQPTWAFDYFTENLGEGTLASRLNMFVWNAHRFEKLIKKHGTIHNVFSKLAHELKVDENLTPETMLKGVSTKGVMEIFVKLLPHLNTLGKRAKDLAVVMADAVAQPENKSLCLKTAMLFFKKADKEPVTAQYMLGKKVWEEGGDVVNLFHEVQNIMAGHMEKAKAEHTYLLSTALLYLGNNVVRTYNELKQAQAVLDFDDLIRLTSELLGKNSHSDWIRYKLDSNIRHALLDEAQDTDSTQWHIIRQFVEEFYAGEGQYESPRTFFAVGDAKQSIYRFRGAEPFVFGDMRDYMLKKKEETGQSAVVENLVASFRSSSTVLNFVDDVFRSEHRRDAVDEYISELKHDAVHENAGGRIEIWPLIKAEKNNGEKREPWTLPVIKEEAPSVKQQVATQVAQSIVSLLNSGDVLHTTKKPVNAEDIMIILRARTLMPALISALDAHKIPHTGADVIDLNKEQLVEDMLQLMLLATNPADAFARMQVLKSPLFGLSDDALLKGEDALPMVLKEFIASAYTLSPYTFLMEAQAKFHIRAKYYDHGDRRQIDETMDALLDSALSYNSHLGLADFVHAFTATPQKVKRELAGAKRRVRLLTAHGSKGLEAPVVYLPDSGKDFYESLARETQLWHVNEKNEDELFLARLSKAESCNFQKEVEAQEKERIFKDEMRLLYVALTRAKDRLYIGGEGKEGADSWYTHIKHALAQLNTFEEQEDGAFVLNNPVEHSAEKAEAVVLDSIESDLPTYATTPPLKGAVASALKASEKMDKDPLELSDTQTLKKLFARGHAVHKLLEILPLLQEEDRENKAQNYINQVLHDFSEDEQQKAINGAFLVLNKYPEFFGKNSRAEVPIFAEKQGKRFDGIIDRLIASENEVTVIDYKTNSIVPENVPEHYAEQLRIYAWALADVFPEKRIKAGIIWTSLSDPRLQWVIDS